MKRILCGALALSLTVVMLTSCTSGSGGRVVEEGDVIAPGSAGNDIHSKNFEVVAETDSLILSVNKDTTHFQVKNKKDGSVYASVPGETSSESENSLLEFSYMDSKGVMNVMTSSADSVKKGQYSIEKIDGGVKILYTFGNVSEKLFVPPAFTVERFEEITAKIDGAFTKSRFKSQYYLANINDINDNDTRSRLLSKYPILKEKPLYLLKNDVLALNVQREINDVLVSTGYTEQDYEKDMEIAKELEQATYPVFNVPLYLTLNGDKFNARVPVNEVEEFHGGVMLAMTVLKTFASPDKGGEGYFLLPDGTGSTMKFYNGKESQQEYTVPVYGRDLAVQMDEKIFKEEVAYLPLFARVTPNGAAMTVIKDGDALAEIKAFPGSADNYAAAYPVFRVREVAKTYLSSASKEQGDFFTVAQKKLYDGSLDLEMSFFDKDHNRLTDLSAAYAKTLFGDSTVDGEVPPVYLEFIGSAKMNTSVMGVSTKKDVTYTTLRDVLTIGQELKSAGVDHMVFRLTGFFDGGLDQPFAQKLKLSKGVGNTADLKELKEWAEKNGVKLYFDADVQYVYEDTLFDGFNKTADSSYLLTKKLGIDYRYNMATYQLDNMGSGYSRYILNPTAVTKAIDGSLSLMDSLEMNTISLRSVGQNVNADYKVNRMIERQNALKMLVESLKKSAESKSVMASGANAAILPYVDHVLDLPSKSMQYDICDEVVPFLQMVLQGRVNYSEASRNLSGNTDGSLLDALRTGTSLNYTITAAEDVTFKKTEHPQYYSTKYSVWKNDIVEKYTMQKEVARVVSSGISSVQTLAEGVHQTTYRNGGVMIVNYSDKAYTAEGVTVEPLSYKILSA